MNRINGGEKVVNSMLRKRCADVWVVFCLMKVDEGKYVQERSLTLSKKKRDKLWERSLRGNKK